MPHAPPLNFGDFTIAGTLLGVGQHKGPCYKDNEMCSVLLCHGHDFFKPKVPVQQGGSFKVYLVSPDRLKARSLLISGCAADMIWFGCSGHCCI